MSILCRLGGHEASTHEVYNCGYWFARCRRCGTDMIRAGAAWGTVPAGHRVVWRSGPANHSIPTNFAHVLPVLHPQANLPMVRPRFQSWSRQMVRAGRQKEPEAGSAEAEEPHYPRLLLIAAIVGASLQLLLGSGARGGAA